MYSLGFYLNMNNIILIRIIDIKTKGHQLFSIFREFCIKNNFNIYDLDVIHAIIALFIRVIITMIVYKDCKNMNNIVLNYKNYVYLFKNNLNNNFKHKLNIEYENFKEYATNNIINDYFRGINTYINYLLNNKEMDVLWI